MKLMLAGDMVVGRGVDQILPYPGDPKIYESWRPNYDARFYVRHAIRRNGPLPEERGFGYIWGDVVNAVDRFGPDVRIVNLETAVTTNPTPWPDKGIHLRLNPDNVPCLAAGRLSGCALANNHVLDWGREGLSDTMVALRNAGIRFAGAGSNRSSAEAPATFEMAQGRRLLLFSMASPEADIPADWAATETRSGVNLIAPDEQHVNRIAALVSAHRRKGDVVMISIHWGKNRVDVPDPVSRNFAHALIDRADIDLIHGHGAHHVREMEVYRGKLILYGCGDMLNDFEGINLYPDLHPELSVTCLVEIDDLTGDLKNLDLIPVRIRNLRMNIARPPGRRWLHDTLNRRCAALGLHVTESENLLRLEWDKDANPPGAAGTTQ